MIKKLNKLSNGLIQWSMLLVIYLWTLTNKDTMNIQRYNQWM